MATYLELDQDMLVAFANGATITGASLTQPASSTLNVGDTNTALTVILSAANNWGLLTKTMAGSMQVYTLVNPPPATGGGGGGASGNVSVNNFPAQFGINNFPAQFGINNFPTQFGINNFPTWNYALITASGVTPIKAQAGVLGFVLNVSTAPLNVTASIFNNTTNSGDIVFTMSTLEAMDKVDFGAGISMSTGITINCGANPNGALLVGYR